MKYTVSSTEETREEEIKRLEKEMKVAERNEDFERCIEISNRIIYLIDLKRLI